MTAPYRVELLARSHDRTTFASGEPQIDDWFRRQAGQASRRGTATVHMLLDTVTDTVIGFYSLSNFAVLAADLPTELGRGLPDRLPLPAHLIGQIGVDARQQGKGYGRTLLFDALRRAYRTTADSASVAVIVHALRPQVAAWYAHYDFIPFPAHPLSLCLPMKDIARLFPISTPENTSA